MTQSIALVEVNSIAAGICVLDAMVKVAPVRVIDARPVTPGKYIILVAGNVSSVDSSRTRGVEVAGETLIDVVFLPQPHPQIFAALAGQVEIPPVDAVGLIETFSVASTILAADAAAKAAGVTLTEVRLAMGLGGKSFVTMLGSVAEVEASVAAGSDAARESGMLVRSVVIPSPHPDAAQKIVRTAAR